MSTKTEAQERRERAARLKQAREAAGFAGPKAVADALPGLNVNNYKAYEGGRNGFGSADAKRFAQLFKVSANWLVLGEGDAREISLASDDSLAMPADPPNASSPVPIEYPTSRLPIYGHAVAGDDGRFVLNGQRIVDILCPPQLLGVPDAYGVFVHGDSMEPRYEAGEAVFVNPHVPVRRGNYVVAQIAGDTEYDDVAGYVKRFVSLNSRELILEQFKVREGVSSDAPELERFTMRFPAAKVVAVHKIVGSSDG